MVDVNPEIWKNQTLGEAVDNQFLDEVEAQSKENRAARREGRPPREVQRVVRYPQMTPSGSVPSNIQDELKFVDSSNPEATEESFGESDSQE